MPDTSGATATNGLLTDRDQFLAATKCDRKVIQIQLPSGKSCFVRTISQRERGELDSWFVDELGQRDPQKWRYYTARKLVAGVCRPDGMLIFCEDDVEAVSEMDALDADTISDALDGLWTNRKSFEELLGNSGSGRKEGPPTESPETAAAST